MVGMNETESPDRPGDDRHGRRRLLRSRDDRVFGGVAGGLGRHFNIDPIIFRVGFAASAFFGGLGIIVYLVLLVAVPEDDGTGQAAPQRGGSRIAVIAAAVVLGILALALFDGPHWGWWWGPGLFFWVAVALVAGYLARRLLRNDDVAPPATAEAGTESTEVQPTAELGPTGRGRPSVGRLLGVIALAFAAVIAAVVLAVSSAWAGAEGHGQAVAALVIVLGILLVGAAVLNAPRWRWLIPLALVLAIPLGAVAAADIHFEGGYGERDYRPTSAAAIPADGYDLAVGNLSIDLRGLDWERGDIVKLPARLGLGELKVLVPDRVCVEANTDAKAGLIDVRGNESWGADVDDDENPDPSDAPRLLLDGELEIGHLEVLDQTEFEERGGYIVQGRDFGPRFRDEDHAAEQARAQAACEPVPAKGGSR
jgi:phage shock protein PspC (stress-responsive transcriptional regulator)